MIDIHQHPKKVMHQHQLVNPLSINLRSRSEYLIFLSISDSLMNSNAYMLTLLSPQIMLVMMKN